MFTELRRNDVNRSRETAGRAQSAPLQEVFHREDKTEPTQASDLHDARCKRPRRVQETSSSVGRTPPSVGFINLNLRPTFLDGQRAVFPSLIS